MRLVEVRFHYGRKLLERGFGSVCTLLQKGLIYRGNRIINWCPHCHTALSDAEVEYEEQQSNLWYYKYPVVGEDDAIVIATTRPETMLGDTAVAVNPKDEKMAKYVGKLVKLPLTDREIPVVADDYCEIGFGTGAVKITPAHDPNDFELGLRHNLPVIQVIGEDGLMNENAGKYKGMDRLTARKAIVEDLTALGLMVKIEPYAHNVGTCYRCGETVESLVSKQWFVKMKPLAEPAIKAVRSKKPSLFPRDLKILISTGWKTSATGAYPVNFGGDTESPRTTATIAAK